MLAGAGHLRVYLKLAEVEADIAKRVRELVPNAVSVQVRLPEVEEVASERLGHEATPLELYRAYCERRYGAAPEAALVEAFAALWAESVGATPSGETGS